MKVRDTAQRSAVLIEAAATLAEAAGEMAKHGVGTLVVVDHRRLVGIVTDRDIVVRGLARALPLDARVDSIMSMNVVAVAADSDIADAVKAFGHHAVRRLPVLDGDTVCGLLSLDDLMVATAQQLGELTRGVTAQIMFPHAAEFAPPPVVFGATG
ncbi:MAG: CBS domain-containing protein [Actinobacteria bacterium]|nr:CBS domain-containing protein [Actinomycetota bacterium]